MRKWHTDRLKRFELDEVDFIRRVTDVVDRLTKADGASHSIDLGTGW